MNRSPRRVLAIASATAFAGAGLALSAPAASAQPAFTEVGDGRYLSVDDLGQAEFNAIDTIADQLNGVIPGEEEIFFVVNKPGPRTAIGIWSPARQAQNSLQVECDPEVDTWESYLHGSCNGNEDALLR